MQEKKTYLNLYISSSVKELLEKHATLEDRTLSNLCDRLLSWAAKHLEEAGGSQALMSWEASPVRRHPSKRVSEELQGQLHSALDIMFERAPSTIIERVAEYLTSRAGKYGEEK